MRKAISLLVATLGLVGCGSTSLTASHPSPSPVAHATSSMTPSASPSARPDPASFPKLTGTYGLLYSLGSLHLVKPNATLAATVGMQWNLQTITCTGNTDSVNIPPPVSASNGHVYFREGSAIRMVV